MKSHYALIVASAVLWSGVASAQTIRSYGTEAEQQYGNQGQFQYPGAPAQPQTVTAPQQTAQSGQPAQQASGEEGEKKEEYTSGVTHLYGGGAPNQPLPKDLPQEQMYRGVIPGTRDTVTHLEKAAKQGQTGTNELLWIGFQPREQSTRVFVQTAREADYTMGTNEAGAVVLTFSNTKLSARNFSRFIDTSFFERNVTRIESKKQGKDVVVTISLRKAERPQVNTTDRYVYLEFSAEKMAADPAAEKKTEDSGESTRALDE